MRVRVSAFSSNASFPGTYGRRASAFERVAFDAAMDACGKWGGDPATLRSVFATQSADAEAVDRMMRGVALDPPLVSPLTFLQSVACTLAGNWAARTCSHASSTTLTAGPHSLGAALLEGAVTVAADESTCLVVLCEVPPPAPLAMPGHTTTPIALALVLTHGPGPGRLLDVRPGSGNCPGLPPEAVVAQLRTLIDGPAGTQLTVPTGKRTSIALQV
ncbi:beta-ketoacyl synthase chain length factor [Luteibacter yeojuensis]|uniref:Beta-ketoacyl synthase-like N-terminal domain-containing protein n=1 Tax=Luteibacter yeojuensis TaxID=345309 RepID=A0A0F3JXE8_9GAMM|nr:beta-ketoacyl synthase chain length factor [Luteibacter yeojuensis]KJV23695.1 hypothetical protein VI08_20600 [Luteibacter yeojuensis]